MNVCLKDTRSADDITSFMVHVSTEDPIKIVPGLLLSILRQLRGTTSVTRGAS